MKSYPFYKDTGIDWIGKIPEHWEIITFKRISSRIDVGIAEAATHAYSDNGVPIIRSKNIKLGEISLDDMIYISNQFAEKNSSKYLYKGDLLTVRTGNAGITAVVPSILNKSQCFTMLITTLNHKCNSFYYSYFLNSTSGIHYFELNSWGTAQKNISVPILGNCPVILAPLEEQNFIVYHLKTKLNKIKKIITKKQKYIELLHEYRAALINRAVTKGLDPNAPMKDSGIPWLGKIPEHWEVKKLKTISNIKTSGVDKKTIEKEISVRLCNYIDVYKKDFITDKIDFMRATATPNEINNYRLHRDDVIITKDSETWKDIAVPAYVSDSLDNVICAYHLTLIRPKHSHINGEYLFRAISANSIAHQFKIAANGVTRYGLSQNAIKNAVITLPPKDEQKKIISYIKDKLFKIDRSIQKIEEEIELLKEYRTSLVSEVVTGKIDVRDTLPKENTLP